MKCPPLELIELGCVHLKGGYAEAIGKGNSFVEKNIAPQDLAYSNPQFIEESVMSNLVLIISTVHSLFEFEPLL